MSELLELMDIINENEDTLGEMTPGRKCALCGKVIDLDDFPWHVRNAHTVREIMAYLADQLPRRRV